MPNTKTYRLKETWQSFQDLEQAILARVHEAYVLAQRQGAAAPKMQRLAPFVSEMFEEVSAPKPAKSPARSDTQP